MRFRKSGLLVLSTAFLLLAVHPVFAQAPTVTLTSPTNGTTYSNPVSVIASASGPNPISRMEVWVNGTKAYQVSGNSINTALNMVVGSNIRVVVQAIDSTGTAGKQVVYINVTSGSGGGGTLAVTVTSPANGGTFPNPVPVQASASGPNPISRMEVWVNGTKSYGISGGSINTSLTMPVGSNIRVTIQAFDSTGATAKQTNYINVTTGGGGGTNTVTIDMPTNNATVPNPVRVRASASLVNPLSRMDIYVDGSKVYFGYSPDIDTQLTLPTGSHRITVQAIDTSSNIFKASATVTVTAPPPGDVAGLKSRVKHIIFMLQENRSTDNYFGKLDQYRQNQGAAPGAFDGLPSNIVLYDALGRAVSPYHFQTVCHENLSPSWNEAHSSWNYGRMDRFMKVASGTTSSIDPGGQRAMGYYDWTDLPFYYDSAWEFATSDRWFAPLLSNTNPNRLYSFAATSFGHIRPDTEPAGGWTQTNIFDRLKAAGITWRVYTQDLTNEWASWANYDGTHVKNISSWANDVQNEATLPQVIYIDRGGSSGLDEHPGENVQTGAARVEQIVRALMNSPSWNSSAFIWSFDEFGGLYDHVQPAYTVLPDDIPPMLRSGDWNATFNQTDFRVPLIVYSPWAKKHYVSHTAMDFTAILRLIEDRFDLPALTRRDAAQPNMTEFFDFSAPSWATPPTLPSQPTNGTCDKTKEKAPGF